MYAHVHVCARLMESRCPCSTTLLGSSLETTRRPTPTAALLRAGGLWSNAITAVTAMRYHSYLPPYVLCQSHRLVPAFPPPPHYSRSKGGASGADPWPQPDSMGVARSRAPFSPSSLSLSKLPCLFSPLAHSFFSHFHVIPQQRDPVSPRQTAEVTVIYVSRRPTSHQTPSEAFHRYMPQSTLPSCSRSKGTVLRYLPTTRTARIPDSSSRDAKTDGGTGSHRVGCVWTRRVPNFARFPPAGRVLGDY